MPSLRRSRSERCRLGPEPIGGIWFAATLDGNDDDDDVMLLNIDNGLPVDEAVNGAGEYCCGRCWCCCIAGLSSVTESNDDSSGKNVLMAVPLPPLKLQLAAEPQALPPPPRLPLLPPPPPPTPIILLIVYFLRVWWLGESLNEPCFGEQSRDDDIFPWICALFVYLPDSLLFCFDYSMLALPSPLSLSRNNENWFCVNFCPDVVEWCVERKTCAKVLSDRDWFVLMWLFVCLVVVWSLGRSF